MLLRHPFLQRSIQKHLRLLTIISAHIIKANPNLKKSHAERVFQQPARRHSRGAASKAILPRREEKRQNLASFPRRPYSLLANITQGSVMLHGNRRAPDGLSLRNSQ